MCVNKWVPVRSGCRRWLLLAAAVVGVALPENAASAASGTWGAGHYHYADGRVCHNGPSSEPLAAWTVSGGHRAYLTRTVSSTGAVDSAAPPVPSAGRPEPAVAVSPGSEFADAEDIAATAYLLSHGGDPATIAAAVLAQTDPGRVPSCVSPGAASAELASARAHSGPYEIHVTVPTGKVRIGQAVTVTVTVTRATGQPAPDVSVTVSVPGANDAHAVTDAGGTARIPVTVTSATADTLPVTATAAASVGLREAGITARRSETNPSGASVPAVFAAPPTSFSGQGVLAVDRTAHPAVETQVPSHLVRTGAAFAPTGVVSGLNGHRASVAFDLLGPLALKNKTLCPGIDAADWKVQQTHVAATVSVGLTGDGTAAPHTSAPARPGCYALRTTVSTTDGAPAVTKRSLATVVAVLDASVRNADSTPAIFAPTSGRSGRLSGALQVGNTYGLAATVATRLVGPIKPADGDCSAAAGAWRDAPSDRLPADVSGRTDSSAAAKTVSGPGGYRFTAAAPDGVGCYRARPVLVLTGPGGDTLSLAAPGYTPVYVVHPTVTATVRRTWSVSPAPVPVQVSVEGLYGLAAHVHTRMYVVPPDPAGCNEATFNGARPAGRGPAAPVPAAKGTVTVDVRSGPTPSIGCYAVVPEVTVDANPAVTVAGRLGSAGSTLIAGVDPDQQTRTVAKHSKAGTDASFIIAMSALGAALLVIAARVALIAWRGRYWPTDEDGAIGPPVPPAGIGLVADDG
jgi:hypothetical protein